MRFLGILGKKGVILAGKGDLEEEKETKKKSWSEMAKHYQEKPRVREKNMAVDCYFLSASKKILQKFHAPIFPKRPNHLAHSQLHFQPPKNP